MHTHTNVYLTYIHKVMLNTEFRIATGSEKHTKVTYQLNMYNMQNIGFFQKFVVFMHHDS